MIEVGDRVRIGSIVIPWSGRESRWTGLEGVATDTRYDGYATLTVHVKFPDGSSTWFADSECILLGTIKVHKNATDTYPEGTIAIYGNPANGQSLTRQADGTWTYNAGSIRGNVASYDDIIRGCKVIHTPGV